MNEVLREFRKSSLWMGFFAGTFIFMYLGVVLIIKYAFIYFEGFIPGFSKTILRAVIYAVIAASVAFLFHLRKRRYSREALNLHKGDIHELVKHLVNTVIFLIALSEVPLISGFFLFFLGAMYYDFYFMAALTAALLYTSIPTVEFLEKRLSA